MFCRAVSEGEMICVRQIKYVHVKRKHHFRSKNTFGKHAGCILSTTRERRTSYMGYIHTHAHTHMEFDLSCIRKVIQKSR
ncbi:hypothetical protein M427DRAFT_60755 [Gonapodya prolifera JEL478]|uniref:Uncharacterized protein n=1 Tax=Gonapodya prolifera (strain JEL478) TaxID=1344416 RepID=A0A139A3I5_GONPJ|nr:hypothetical protein M427DRAFT_60755 [Gonapodya prolifera JEL478]|eukprot:KXS11340.1 hypothetical protein M427DRAFT_60755 [Gonapodya prolifera JEL478]